MKLKKLFKAALRYVVDADYRFMVNTDVFRLYKSMPDKKYVERKYRASMGRSLNLDHPVTFNEKLQWLKLHDRNPAYVTMVDKVAAKEYVAALIGEQYIVPTLGVWDDPDEIDFEKLPSRFALKCNHNSGRGMYICHDKAVMDINRVKAGLRKGLAEEYYLTGREWPYKDVDRKIFAEQYIESDAGGLTDYKIHCFNGEPKFILVCKDRFTKTGLTEDFFTPEWEHMPLKRPKINTATAPIDRPTALTEMLSLAKTLAKDIPFVRVDLYIVGERVYFSELTFFPAAGFEGYDPPEWDKTFGSWLSLPDGN